MKIVTMYQPLNRELLSELFLSGAVESSLSRKDDGSCEIQLRDTRILRQFNQPHSVIDYNEVMRIKIHNLRMEALRGQFERA